MSEISVAAFFKETRPAVEDALMRYLPVSGGSASTDFNDAMRASVGSRGKRLRPLITLCITHALGGSVTRAMPTAVAIEYVHSSSLIIDDLPMMDNASVRRSQPATHVRFGEAVALLVAIALLNRAYELTLIDGTAQTIEIHRWLTRSIGESGMIRGQVADLGALRRNAGELSVARCSAEVMLKTTPLFQLCLIAGGLCADAPSSSLKVLAAYGEALGTAFQLNDDLQDARADAQLAQERRRATQMTDTSHMAPDEPMNPAGYLSAALEKTSEIAALSDLPQLRSVLSQLTSMLQHMVAAVIVRQQLAYALQCKSSTSDVIV